MGVDLVLSIYVGQHLFVLALADVGAAEALSVGRFRPLSESSCLFVALSGAKDPALNGRYAICGVVCKNVPLSLSC